LPFSGRRPSGDQAQICKIACGVRAGLVSGCAIDHKLVEFVERLFEVLPFFAIDHEMLIEMGIFVFVIEDIIFRFWNIRVINYPGVSNGRHDNFSRAVQFGLDIRIKRAVGPSLYFIEKRSRNQKCEMLSVPEQNR